MPTFEVSGTVTISILKTIEAKSAKEALLKAGDLSIPRLCHQCAEGGKDEDNTWELTGELDGEAQDLTIKRHGRARINADAK